MYYSQQIEEKFDLFKKADACEFLQCLLEIIHFNLNDDDSKKDADSLCNPKCYIH